LTNNKDIINITFKSINESTNEVEFIESPINTLGTEKTNSSIIEESTTSTFGWLFNLPYIGIKKIFSPIKDFILNFFWTPVSSTSDELETPIQALNSELDAAEESISQEEQNRILDEVLSNTIVANHQQEHLSDIKGKKEYEASEISNWACLIHIDVITKLYDLLVEQQHTAFAKIQEVQGRDLNLGARKALEIKEQLDELMSNKKSEGILIEKTSIIENNQANLPNSKGKEEFKEEVKSSEFYVPATYLIMPQEFNLKLIGQQLPLVEDGGQSSNSHVSSNSDKPHGVFIELPYQDPFSPWTQAYNSVILKEAENLMAKNNIIKDLELGATKFTDAKLNEILNCIGRQLSQDPEIKKNPGFQHNKASLKTYFDMRMMKSHHLLKKGAPFLPISIVEIVEFVCKLRDFDKYFPKMNQNEIQYFKDEYMGRHIKELLK
jgi:hypothetical protein